MPASSAQGQGHRQRLALPRRGHRAEDLDAPAGRDDRRRLRELHPSRRESRNARQDHVPAAAVAHLDRPRHGLESDQLGPQIDHRRRVEGHVAIQTRRGRPPHHDVVQRHVRPRGDERYVHPDDVGRPDGRVEGRLRSHEARVISQDDRLGHLRLAAVRQQPPHHDRALGRDRGPRQHLHQVARRAIGRDAADLDPAAERFDAHPAGRAAVGIVARCRAIFRVRPGGGAEQLDIHQPHPVQPGRARQVPDLEVFDPQLGVLCVPEEVCRQRHPGLGRPGRHDDAQAIRRSGAQRGPVADIGLVGVGRGEHLVAKRRVQLERPRHVPQPVRRVPPNHPGQRAVLGHQVIEEDLVRLPLRAAVHRLIGAHAAVVIRRHHVVPRVDAHRRVQQAGVGDDPVEERRQQLGVARDERPVRVETSAAPVEAADLVGQQVHRRQPELADQPIERRLEQLLQGRWRADVVALVRVRGFTPEQVGVVAHPQRSVCRHRPVRQAPQPTREQIVVEARDQLARLPDVVDALAVQRGPVLSFHSGRIALRQDVEQRAVQALDSHLIEPHRPVPRLAQRRKDDQLVRGLRHHHVQRHPLPVGRARVEVDLAPVHDAPRDDRVRRQPGVGADYVTLEPAGHEVAAWRGRFQLPHKRHRRAALAVRRHVGDLQPHTPAAALRLGLVQAPGRLGVARVDREPAIRQPIAAKLLHTAVGHEVDHRLTRYRHLEGLGLGLDDHPVAPAAQLHRHDAHVVDPEGAVTGLLNPRVDP